ncbi:MAG: M48 family metalloprotease [Bacillota bacterium]
MLFFVLYTLAGLMMVLSAIMQLDTYTRETSKSKKRTLKKSLLNKVTFLAIFFLWPFYLFGYLDLDVFVFGLILVFIYHVTISFLGLPSIRSAVIHVFKSPLFVLTVFFALYLYFFVLSPLLLSGLVLVFLGIVLLLFDRLHPLILQRLFRVVPYYYREELPFLKDMQISKKLHMIEIEGYGSMKNAMIVGLFKPFRLYVFKGMLASMTHREIMGIIAHEVGHVKRGHLRIRILLGALGLFLAFAAGISVVQLDNAFLLNFTLIVLTYIILGYLYRTLLALLLQRQEFEADDYAQKVGQGETLKSALGKLKRGEAPIRNRVYHKLTATHPPTEERIENLSKKPQ